MTDEVKAAQAQRQRRLKLQTSYGQAMMLSRGFASEELSVAFTRARELFDQLGERGRAIRHLLRASSSASCCAAKSDPRVRLRDSVPARSQKAWGV